MPKTNTGQSNGSVLSETANQEVSKLIRHVIRNEQQEGETTQMALQRYLSLSQGAVSRMYNRRDYPSHKTALRAEIATNGRVKAVKLINRDALAA